MKHTFDCYPSRLQTTIEFIIIKAGKGYSCNDDLEFFFQSNTYNSPPRLIQPHVINNTILT